MKTVDVSTVCLCQIYSKHPKEFSQTQVCSANSVSSVEIVLLCKTEHLSSTLSTV